MEKRWPARVLRPGAMSHTQLQVRIHSYIVHCELIAKCMKIKFTINFGRKFGSMVRQGKSVKFKTELSLCKLYSRRGEGGEGGWVMESKNPSSLQCIYFCIIMYVYYSDSLLVPRWLCLCTATAPVTTATASSASSAVPTRWCCIGERDWSRGTDAV